MTRNGNAVQPAQEWLWRLSRRYAIARGWIKDHTGRNVRGLGILLRRIKTDREFSACGFRWFFDHRIASTYLRLISGQFGEPETQDFLQFIAGHLNDGFSFIDVGANIGEMVVAMAAHRNVAQVIAFEPHPVCFEVARKNLDLNGLAERAQLHRQVVGDGTDQPYMVDEKYAPTSGIRADLPNAPRTRTARLDDELKVEGRCVMLIDVETAELDVMMGAARWIEKNHPLIIFEYHAITRQHYSLEDVRRVLGPGFELLRLRQDGYLDRDLRDTYNVVAVHRGSLFASLCEQRMSARPA